MLARVSQRTGRQWLRSNLWGGSVTVLFLAPLPRVSVSCGSYQLLGPMIGPQPSHPARPRRRVSALLSPLMSLSPAVRRGGGSAFMRRDWHTHTQSHAPSLTPTPPLFLLPYSTVCVCFCPIIDFGPRRRGRDRSKLMDSDLHYCTTASRARSR